MSKSQASTGKTKPPTPAELVAQIRQASEKVQADPAKFAAAAKYTNMTTKSRRFNYDRQAPDGVPIYYFHTQGEQLTGVIGKSQRARMARGIAVSCEYLTPIVLDDDTLFYLPNNKRLKKAIEKANAWFQRVTVTYLGRLSNAHGHYEKVYRVEAAPLGKDGVGSRGAEILAKAAKEAAGRKRSK